MNEKILSKIQKLLALGESPNENEAKAAISKAYELMALHNVSINELKASEYTEIVLEVYEGYLYNKTAQGWINDILQHHFNVVPFLKVILIGRNNNGRRKKEFTVGIYGSKSNVLIAEHVSRYLNSVYRDLYCEQKKTDKYLHRESFYRGLTWALKEKLEESKVNINQEYGIVPVQDINLDEFSGKLKKGRKSKTRYHDPSILAGEALGKTINIYTGIN